jgi:uncharacterized SAM-binding protein YcdF (DUF218 family)
MFFVFSKVLHFLLSPYTWIMFMLIFALISKKAKRKRNLSIAGVVLLYLFSLPVIADRLINAWEVPAVSQDSLTEKPYEAIIVLGGLSFWDHELNRIQFNRSSDRIFQALDVYKKGIAKKIIISGGSGSMRYPDDKESIFIKNFLVGIGFKNEDILIESLSRNTYENALYTKDLIDELNMTGPFLLSTSAFHMKRSMACFERQGIKATPYSTDRYSGEFKPHIEGFIVPSQSAINVWETLLHEWFGYFTYKIMGYL